MCFIVTARKAVQSVDMLRPFRTPITWRIMKISAGELRDSDGSRTALSKIFKKHVKIVVYSPNVSDDVISKMYMVPCKDPEKLMETAYQLCGKEDPKVLFYPQPAEGAAGTGKIVYKSPGEGTGMRIPAE